MPVLLSFDSGHVRLLTMQFLLNGPAWIPIKIQISVYQ